MAELNQDAIEAGANGDKLMLRTVLLQMYAMLQSVGGAVGQGVPQSSNGRPSATEPPTQASIDVAGANGAYTATITPGAQGNVSVVYFEVSYADDSNFTQNVVTLPISTNTHVVVQSPGVSAFFRVRASFDKTSWSDYSYANNKTAVTSGLQSSAASAPAVPLNITNYANVDSADAGGSANIRIYGAGGPGTPWIGVKGGKEAIFPSATIIGADFGSDIFTGYDNDGEQYLAKGTLPEVFPDSVTPVGKVSVVGSGAVTEPTVALVLDGAGHVIAWNVLTQGNGLTGPVTLVITTATGSGATYGAQQIVAGKLISIAPGNPGIAYDPSDTVVASGGVFSGQPGGGTELGTNGGRLTAV